MSIRLVLCWGGVSGYMAACWRALAAMPGVELHVFSVEQRRGAFDPQILRGVQCRVLEWDQCLDGRTLLPMVRELKPDVLFTTGWSTPAYRALVGARELKSVPKWIGVDTPWRGTIRQQLGRVALRRLMARADLAIVAGERAWQYVRRLGVSEARIMRGLYGVDYETLAPLWDQRCGRPEGWPKRFVFIGRYHAEKGIVTLLEGYSKYRSAVKDPWPLTCCGTGELEGMLAGRAGVENAGFRQPSQIIDVLRGSGAFVLASEFDPWPLVVVEASAAGLPVICTEACGSSVELVRPYFNGVTVASGDPGALADGLRFIHANADRLPEMGRRGRDLAAAYSAQMWARRWDWAARQQCGVK